MRLAAMLRRWAYMAVAIVATILITVAPIFSFRYSDAGMEYIRSAKMDLKEYTVMYTVKDGMEQKVNNRPNDPPKSVIMLYVLQKIMFWTCIACVFLFYPTRVRWYLSWFIIAVCALFYFFIIKYAQDISYDFVTLAPTWVAFMPAVVIAMMILLNRNVARFGNYFDDIAE